MRSGRYLGENPSGRTAAAISAPRWLEIVELNSACDIAREIEAPNERVARIRPLLIAIKAGGALICAAVTRHVRLKPNPKPRMLGYTQTAVELERVAVAMQTVIC